MTSESRQGSHETDDMNDFRTRNSAGDQIFAIGTTARFRGREADLHSGNDAVCAHTTGALVISVPASIHLRLGDPPCRGIGPIDEPQALEGTLEVERHLLVLPAL